MDDPQFGKGENGRPEDFLGYKAWRHEEINAGFKAAAWAEKDPQSGFATYPKRNQGMQSSCTCYVIAKQLAIDELSESGLWREFSPRSIYPYVFAPGGGASSLAATKMVCKIGMSLEVLLPTDGLSEEKVESSEGYVVDAKQVALVYKPSGFVEAASDFETIASIIQGYKDQGLKKGVAVSVIGLNNGTWLSPFPKPPTGPTNPGLWYHRVIVTDFGLINGKKFLAIDNSAGMNVGYGGQQFLSKDYEPLLYGAIYTLNQPDDWQQTAGTGIVKPVYQWFNDLTIGSTGPDVLALQQALQSLGFFPVSTVVKPTGNFYGVTKQAVDTFQAAFAIPVTGIVDMPTRVMLNSIFKM